MSAARPSYFILRPASNEEYPHGPTQGMQIVPLIPVDLLPKWVEVQGFPRQLNLDQTVGMTNLGTFPGPDEVLRLRFLDLEYSGVDEDGGPPTNSPDRRNNRAGSGAGENSWKGGSSQYHQQHVSEQAYVPGNSSKGDHMKSSSDSWRPTFSSGSSSPLQSRDKQQSATQKFKTQTQKIGNERSVIGSSSTTSTNSKITSKATLLAKPKGSSRTTVSGTDDAKRSASGPSASRPSTRYCRAWCQKGSCRFGAACYNIHSMPQTVADLEAVGLEDYPTWWLATEDGMDAIKNGNASSKETPRKRDKGKTPAKAEGNKPETPGAAGSPAPLTSWPVDAKADSGSEEKEKEKEKETEKVMDMMGRKIKLGAEEDGNLTESDVLKIGNLFSKEPIYDGSGSDGEDESSADLLVL